MSVFIFFCFSSTIHKWFVIWGFGFLQLELGWKWLWPETGGFDHVGIHNNVIFSTLGSNCTGLINVEIDLELPVQHDSSQTANWMAAYQSYTLCFLYLSGF